MKLLAVLAALALAASTPMRAGPDAVATFLAELARRRPVETATLVRHDETAECAKQLRSIFEKHPKQKKLYSSKAKLKATRKTRRAGATAGGVRELLARAIEIPGFRATYVTTTRGEARDRAWRNDTQSGFVQVIEHLGAQLETRGVDAFRLGGIKVEVRDHDLALEFANGSRIDLAGYDTIRAIGKKRGNAKHVFWIDEAQDFRFLEEFYNGTVIGALVDFKGECWVSGTPGRDAAGMFYEITRDDDQAMEGWEVHEIAVTDNPYFGCVVWEGGTWFVVDQVGTQTGPYENEAVAEEAAIKIRWEGTAGEAIRLNAWPPDHPDLIREWYARWVTTDTRHVYPVNAVPPTCKLIYAPQRLVPNTWRPQDNPSWYNHDAAIADLPRRTNGGLYEWMFGVGIDFGNFPDPFALVVWSFTFERPDVYEMFSWKAVKVLPDDQRVYVEMLWRAMNNIIVLVADPAGREGELEAWRTRFNMPIENAEKANKNVFQELMAGDIRKGHIHYREGSPILDEHRHLVYLPTKPGKTRKEHADRKLSNGRVPGNHCSDAGLYSHRHLNHFLFRAPPPDERTANQKQADEYEKNVDRVHELRDALREQGEIDEYENGYSWGDT